MRWAPSLHSTIFFWLSTMHNHADRLSRIVRQISESSKKGIPWARFRSCYRAYRQDSGRASGLRHPAQVFHGSGITYFISITYTDSTFGVGMARKCHRQDVPGVLFFFVSSSGGGLPGRPGLERVAGRSLFWSLNLVGPQEQRPCAVENEMFWRRNRLRCQDPDSFSLLRW